MAWLEPVADEAGGWRKMEGWLGVLVGGIGLNLGGELFAHFGCGVRSDEHAVAATFAYGFHDEVVKIGEYMAALFFVREKVGFHVGDDGIFVEVIADDTWDVGVESLVVGEARAEGVGDGDVAGAIGVEQAGAAQNGVAAEDERLAKIVIDAPVDDIDALQAVSGAHVDDVVVGDEVAALDEIDTHLAGEVCVLEISGVEDARGKEDDVGLGPSLRSQRAQRGEQQLRILLDGAHAVAVEEVRECALHDPAIGEHVADAGGYRSEER